MDKRTIRKLITEKKRSLSAEEIAVRSEKLADRLFTLDEYRNSDTVYVYISINQEVRTDRIIERALNDGKRVAVPRVISEDSYGTKLALPKQHMEFVFIDADTVYADHNGIPEPQIGEIADSDALVIVPGLAFGRDKNRIGYGGGFYDRYFAAHRNRNYIKVGLCFDFQVFDAIEADDTDEKTDILFYE